MGNVGMKVRVDERGRITIPNKIREDLGINPDTELTIEAQGSTLVLFKRLSPEELIDEARRLQRELQSSKIGEEEPLKVKKIWKGSA